MPTNTGFPGTVKTLVMRILFGPRSPGVGPLIALVILPNVGDVSRFGSARAGALSRG